MTQQHPFPPLYDAQSEILILGSFPSVKSREGMFFYHHPQNRFWRVLAAVLNEPVPRSIPEKAALLHRRHIALWDVIASCEIVGSSDSSIREVVANDLTPILREAPIRAIFCNGGTAYGCFRRYTRPRPELPVFQLPSTSPANAAWSLERLTEAWRVVAETLGTS